MKYDIQNGAHAPDLMDESERFRVLGIHGAIEQHEIGRHALTHALTEAENAGAATELLDLSELTLPLYNPELEPRDAVVLVRCVLRADAVLLATSVRHDSYSTQLKNALEYCAADEFDGTPVGLLGVADADPATALDHLRTVCTMLKADVLTTQVSLSVETGWNHDELSTDCVSELRTLGQHIVDQTDLTSIDH